LWAWIIPFSILFFLLIIVWEVSRTDALVRSIILLFIVKAIQSWSPDFIHSTKVLDSRIDELFNTSNHFLYIISPYFIPGENRLKSIRNACKAGCAVTILIHNNALNNDRTRNDLKRLQESGCEIFIHPHLHSKIYLNESAAITGSVNLVKGSFENSLEIGMNTKNVTQHREILNLIKNEYFDDDDIEEFDEGNLKHGFCIRTKSKIRYNIKIPIMYEEYKTSDDKSGKYCHECGREAKTSVNQPLCDECNKLNSIEKN
jgi:hypothetical protein